jgi:Holliday junction resolvasome RuvABC endonuclease subunit
MNNDATILALDMSSTSIGLCYNGQTFETFHLTGDIASRCRQAAAWVKGQLYLFSDIDLVVIESPVARFASAVIPQARVSGAVLALLSTADIAWQELPPQAAKMALCQKGNARKMDMILAARQRLPDVVFDEHRADALGLWVAARAMKVEKVAA